MAFQGGDLVAALRIPDARTTISLSTSQIRAVLSRRRRHQPLAVAAERRAIHDKEIAVLKGHTDFVRSAAFSGDRKRVV